MMDFEGDILIRMQNIRQRYGLRDIQEAYNMILLDFENRQDELDKYGNA